MSGLTHSEEGGFFSFLIMRWTLHRFVLAARVSAPSEQSREQALISVFRRRAAPPEHTLCVMT